MPELQNLEKPADLATKEKTTNRNSKTIKLGVASVALASATAFGMAQPAQAETINNTLGQGLTLRSQPNTSSANFGNIPERTHVDPECHIEGESIIGDNIWHRITHNGKQGYITDAYLYGDTPKQTRYYPTSAELVADGIPRCDNLNNQPARPQQEFPDQLQNPQPAPKPQPQPQKPQQEQQKPQEKHLPCTPLLFIGARGSGNPYEDDGLGDQVRPVADELKKTYGDQITVHGLPYEAVPAFEPINNMFNGEYIDSVAIGRQILKNTIEVQDQNCPGQKFILAGHSQGADVINDYASLGEIANSKIVAITTFGDPQFNPNASNSRGNYNSLLGGSLAHREEFSQEMINKSVSYCKSFDFVCNFEGLNFILMIAKIGTHGDYKNDYVHEATDFIKSKLYSGINNGGGGW